MGGGDTLEDRHSDVSTVQKELTDLTSSMKTRGPSELRLFHELGRRDTSEPEETNVSSESGTKKTAIEDVSFRDILDYTLERERDSVLSATLEREKQSLDPDPIPKESL